MIKFLRKLLKDYERLMSAGIPYIDFRNFN